MCDDSLINGLNMMLPLVPTHATQLLVVVIVVVVLIFKSANRLMDLQLLTDTQTLLSNFELQSLRQLKLTSSTYIYGFSRFLWDSPHRKREREGETAQIIMIIYLFKCKVITNHVQLESSQTDHR